MLSQATASLEYHWFECMSTTFLFFFHFTSIFVFSPALYTQYTPILYCFLELLPRLLLVTSNSLLLSNAFWTFCLASCLLRPIHSYYLMIFGPFNTSPACYTQHLCYSQNLPMWYARHYSSIDNQPLEAIKKPGKHRLQQPAHRPT